MTNPTTVTNPTPPAFTPKAIDRIAKAICADRPSSKRLLAKRLNELVDTVRQLRTGKLNTSPSGLVAQLNRAASQPRGFADSAATQLATMDHALAMDLIPALPLVIWQLALRVDPARPERWEVQQAVRDRMKHRQYGEDEIRKAILDAIKVAAPSVKPGRGGARHCADQVLEEAARHLLVIFREVTGRQGRPAYDPIKERVYGPVVDFFQLCLPIFGWQKSPNAIRGLIRKVVHKPDFGGEKFHYG